MSKTTSTIVYILIGAIMALMPKQMKASAQPEFYRRYVNVPTEQLFSMGEKMLDKDNRIDSALVCMTIIGNRYSDEMGEKEKLLCAKAFLNQWKIYFLYYYDFNKQYEALVKAKNIFDGLKTEETELYLDFGVVYQTLYDQVKDRKMGFRAINYYRKAFAASVKSHDEETFEPTFTNLITTAAGLGRLGMITKEWNIYRQLKVKKYKVLHRYNVLFYHAMTHYQSKSYDEAFKYTILQLKTVHVNPQYDRFRYIALANLADIRACQHRYNEAVDFIKQALEQAKRADMPDGKLEAYQYLSDYYQEMGQ